MSSDQAIGLDARSSHHDAVPVAAISTRRRVVSSRETEQAAIAARAKEAANLPPLAWDAQLDECMRLVSREVRRLVRESDTLALAGVGLSDEQWARLREVTMVVRQNVALATRPGGGGEDPAEVSTDRLMKGAKR
jgi:hypothetical protein